jgi:hypothetical protein
MYNYFRHWPRYSDDDEQAQAAEAGLARGSGGGGPIKDLFDSGFNGAARSEMYRAQLFPDLFPHEKPMLIHNWSKDDLEMFCGRI